jgi:hypothetical protein
LLVAPGVKPIVLVIAAASLAACTEQPPRATGSYIESHVESYDYPGSIPVELDVLIVVDDTAAMAPYTPQVKGFAADLVTVISSANEGAAPTTRIAVITANASAASFRQPAGTTDPYISFGLDARFEPTANISGSIAETLEPMLDVGTAGTAPVAPLEAVAAALDAQPTFLRPDSYLGIITIAASDDASLGATADYAASLKARRSDPTKVLVTGVFPQPAPRLDAFHSSFPNRNTAVDVDNPDWSDLLALYAQQSRQLFGVPCITTPADLDPETPGPQYDCSLGAYYADGTSEPLPYCTDGGPTRCWAVVADPINCYYGNEQSLEVRGFPGYFRPTVRGQCVVEGP